MLRLKGITKRFGSITAIQDIDLKVAPGEVHVLFGENGAGKSTLINVIAGTIRADSGSRHFKNKNISDINVYDTRMLGIVPVFQEFSLIPEMSVVDNLFLGREIRGAFSLLNRKAMYAQSYDLISGLGFEVDLAQKVSRLSRAEQQMVEITKALLDKPSVLILDEPTASLTDNEAEKLFSVIEDQVKQGTSVIYVSHRMPEIRRLANTITVLRNGRVITTVPIGKVSDEQLIEWMTGEKTTERYPEIKHDPSERVLEVSNLTLKGGQVVDASIYARKGEVVGIAGLIGSGKSDLIRACFGLLPIEEGEIRIYGKKVNKPTPRSMLKVGMCYFPSDRNAEGLALSRSIRENVSIAALDTRDISSSQGFLYLNNEIKKSQEVLEKLLVRMNSQEQPVDTLSGGNRQKVLLARGLIRDINLFLFDEPTVGIDVGAKLEIYELIKQLAESGAAVVLVSSELPEVVNLSNRIYVMKEGVINAHIKNKELTEEAVLPYFFMDQHEKEETAK